MSYEVIAGRKPVMEALKAGTSIERIVILVGVQGRVIDEIKDAAESRGVQWAEVNKQRFRELAVDTTTQGVLAIIPSRAFVPIERLIEIGEERGERGFLILLDEIEDPHNMGAIIRSAECAGAHGVVVTRHHSSSITSTVTKASAGATEHIALAEATNLVQTIEGLKERGYWIVGLDGSGEKDYTEVDYTSPTALVIGNEGKGIRRLVREHCDYRVRIPMRGKIRSLNASVAGALVMYEVLRMREASRQES